ncbi:MAG: beta-ketoacyl-ACP synthase [Hyphomicrobiaceae bacterium]
MGKPLNDHKGRPVVVVTGFGVITSLGRGKQDNWRALTNAQSGLHTITRFPTDGLRTTVAGTVDFMDLGNYSAPRLSAAMASAAVREAISDSGIGTKGMFPGPLFLATPPTELEWPQRRALFARLNGEEREDGYRQLLKAARSGRFKELFHEFQFSSVGEWLAAEFGTQGLPISLSTACASGATALMLGVEAIRRGETDTALCVATDGSVHAEALIRFSLLSALSTYNEPPEKASRPFAKDRGGFVMAEGACAFVLESYEAAKTRGAEVLGVIKGCGERADEFHRTRTHPEGKPIIAAIRGALSDAGVAPEDIDYINAHGTGTQENDKMEYLSLKAVLGDAIETTPISSNKSMIGHTLTAAGAIEAAFSLMSIRDGILPPTINYDLPDPEIPLDVVPNVSRQANISNVLSNSFGFGGQNASLVLSAEPA